MVREADDSTLKRHEGNAADTDRQKSSPRELAVAMSALLEGTDLPLDDYDDRDDRDDRGARRGQER